MFSAHDRYALAMGVLNGDAQTNLILADMLDEEGDRSLAEWARAPKKKRHKRLDFVIAVLPFKTSLRLGCDCLAHALENYRETDSLIKAIRLVSSWAQSQVDEESLEQGCQTVSRVTPWRFGIINIDQTCQILHAAAKSGTSADYCESSGQDSRLRVHASETRSFSRRVIRASRQMVKPTYWQSSVPNHMTAVRRQKSTKEPSVELAWQHSHVEIVIREMLEQFDA